MEKVPHNIKKSLSYNKKSNQNTSLDNLEYGKLPPQALDLEGALLGAIMIEKRAVDKIIDVISSDSFYADKHQTIYRAIKSLYEKTDPIDILTVTEELKKMGKLEDAGGAYYVTSLTNRVASSANIESHARIIAQKYIKRELITISSDSIKDAFDDTVDAFELIDEAETKIFTIKEDASKSNGAQLSDLLRKEIGQIEERYNKPDDEKQLTGVTTGFNELDQMTAGWQPSDLVIIAARPGMGKTALTLSLAKNAAINDKKRVAFFSLEMSSTQLVQRLISMETELKSDQLRKGTLKQHEWAQLTTKVETLRNAPIYIDDTPALNIFDLRAKARRLQSKHGIDLIIVDYLQLMSGTSDSKSGGNREQEISAISRSLKGLAKELEVPVIALSQLSRAVETRGGTKRPLLSDLRESGAIEQDADMVMFIYRPEYYDIYEDENGQDTTSLAELIIAKNRHGATRTVNLKFIKEFTKFDNYSFGYGNDSTFSPVEDSGYITVQSKASEINDDDLPFAPDENYN